MRVLVAGDPTTVIAPHEQPLDGGDPGATYHLDGYTAIPLALLLRDGATGAAWHPAEQRVVATRHKATVARAGDVDWAAMDARAYDTALTDFDSLHAVLDDVLALDDLAISRAEAAERIGVDPDETREQYAARLGMFCPAGYVDSNGWVDGPDRADVREDPTWVARFRAWRDSLPADTPVQLVDIHR